jgi:hypothetical protein
MTIHPSRRALLAGATALVPATFLFGCSTSVTFAMVKGYLSTIVAAVNKLAPIIESLNPALAARLTQILTDVNAAWNAFTALPGPAGGASVAQTIVTLTEEALSIAASVPGLPPSTAAILTGVEILLVTVAGFFNLSAPTPTAEMAPAVLSLRAAALARYNATSDKRHVANTAQAQVQAWLNG